MERVTRSAPQLVYRHALPGDIPALAQIRAADWETEEFWRPRIRGYMLGENSPRHALAPRSVFLCTDGDEPVGLVAGHLTRRFGCDGELQWISVKTEHRSRGIASELLRRLVGWFVEQNVRRVCVDVQPSNAVARRFYGQHGAVDFQPSWMIWHDISQVLQARQQP